MAKKKSAKLILKKTNPVTKAAILAATVLSLVALMALYSSVERLGDQYEAMRKQAQELESDNDQLHSQINDLGSWESAIRIAMEELGLTFPDSIIVTPGN